MKICKNYREEGQCMAIHEQFGKVMPCRHAGDLQRCYESIKKEAEEGKSE